MEPIVNYLEDTEKKLMTELKDLFNKMRANRNTLALEGIEDMYGIKPMDGVVYEPYVRIPFGGFTSHFNAHIILPKDEIVIDAFTSHKEIYNKPMYTDIIYCIGLTNYGRLFNMKPISKTRGPFQEESNFGIPDSSTNIIKLEPLYYKLPMWFYNVFKQLYKTISNSVIYPDKKNIDTILSDATNSIQALNKEFYQFAGKWNQHITEYATLDIDTMRFTIDRNNWKIQELTERKTSLEEENTKLRLELEKLKKANTSLEKEKARLQPFEKYKSVLMDFLDKHYDGNPYDFTKHESIIKSFREWYSNKKVIDKDEYNNMLQSMEELNEYRIYKKVQNEMISGGVLSGMDASSISRNVLKLKKNLIKEDE